MQVVAQMGLSQWLLGVVIIVVCCFLMLVILVQRGRGGGLAGAFGGGGGSSAFGAKTGDVFTWITVAVVVLFLVLASVGNFVFDRTPEARATAPADTAAPAESAEPTADDSSVPPPVPPVGGDLEGSTPPGEAVPSEAGGPGTTGADTTEKTDVVGDKPGSDAEDQPAATRPDNAAGETSAPAQGGSEDQPSP